MRAMATRNGMRAMATRNACFSYQKDEQANPGRLLTN